MKHYIDITITEKDSVIKEILAGHLKNNKNFIDEVIDALEKYNMDIVSKTYKFRLALCANVLYHDFGIDPNNGVTTEELRALTLHIKLTGAL